MGRDRGERCGQARGRDRRRGERAISAARWEELRQSDRTARPQGGDRRWGDGGRSGASARTGAEEPPEALEREGGGDHGRPEARDVLGPVGRLDAREPRRAGEPHVVGDAAPARQVEGTVDAWASGAEGGSTVPPEPCRSAWRGRLTGGQVGGGAGWRPSFGPAGGAAQQSLLTGTQRRLACVGSAGTAGAARRPACRPSQRQATPWAALILGQPRTQGRA